METKKRTLELMWTWESLVEKTVKVVVDKGSTIIRAQCKHHDLVKTVKIKGTPTNPDLVRTYNYVSTTTRTGNSLYECTDLEYGDEGLVYLILQR